MTRSGHDPSPIRPERLAEDFGSKSEVARQGVLALYRAVLNAEQPSVHAAITRWKTLLANSGGPDMDRPSKKIDKLAVWYALPTARLDPAAVVFALHTYYAVLVKLLVGQITARRLGLPNPAETLMQAETTSRLFQRMREFESGPLVAPVKIDVSGRRSLGDCPNFRGATSDGCREDTPAAKMGLSPLDAPEGDSPVFSVSACSNGCVHWPKNGTVPNERSRIDGASRGDPLAWYLDAESESVARWIRAAAAKIDRYATDAPSQPGPAGDVFGRLYQELFPKKLRHGLGEYYTPDWLAAHVLDEAGYTGQPDRRLLDPACGSGVFLMAAIQRIRDAHAEESAPRDLGRRIRANVAGFDLNPLAVMAARANYLLAIGDLLTPEETPDIPVYLRDAILEEARPGETFDYVVGNPPWIAWDHLPEAYREATKPLWEHYGLFTLSGTEARHGGGKKDLSMLMLHAAADRYLNTGGRLGFVITQTLFQTKGAGDGFRRFRLGAEGTPLRVLRVDDLVGFQPFRGAANWTATVVLEKGQPTTYPVPYVKWQLDGRLPETADNWRNRFTHRNCDARPIDPARPRSPWLVLPSGLDLDVARLTGPSDYQAHLGANSGGAAGVYWLEVLGLAEDGVLVRNLSGKGKRAVELVECVLEPDLLYPLARWGDVRRYRAVPAAHLLLAQDPATRKGIDESVMRERYPRTHAYLTRFREILTARAAYRRYQDRAAFYSMYNVGPYTVAPIKVVWRRMDRRINAAVLEPIDDPVLGRRPTIAQETCVQLEADSSEEAHYLSAVLNSSIANFLVAAHSVDGGKGFGTPSMLDFLNLRRFDSANSLHAALAQSSQTAHRLAFVGQDVTAAQHQINELAAALWGLTARQRESIEQA